MGKTKSTNYYTVALALPAIWKQHIYTYESDAELLPGTVVLGPFGKTEKLGIVTAKVQKPEYDTKAIGHESDFVISKSTQEFMQWISDYYPGSPGAHVQHFVPSFLKNIPEKPRKAKIKEIVALKQPEPFTKEQINAFTQLTATDSPRTSVLHGITGSGKTRLYCELAKHNMQNGKNTLILYPEISLTSQLEQTLLEFFGTETVSIYHSKRTSSEQRNTWMRLLKNKSPSIIIGPRSALFLPHDNLGLVIVDEAHDSAYKQDTGTRYNGIVAAGALARHHNAKLLLGSATPPVQETEQILSKGGLLVCMHELAKKSEFAEKKFSIVDMTKANNRTGSFLLSKILLENIRLSLSNKKQSLLFLNKRGTARMLLCDGCGWHAECPHCEMPLTHHHDSFTLQCHVCGYRQKSLITCPDCNHSLTLKNPGIKAIEQDIKTLFPHAKIARFDSDNKKKDTFQENYEQIKSGGADIIIGTQLLTKGLDLPLLDTVGILQADSALLLPDYTSEERTFQQLTQVSGRVGRGHSAGTVIVQTYQPSSYIFPFVTAQDWHGFYKQELQKRKHNNYPPYSYAMKIWVSKNNRDTAMQACKKLVSTLVSNNRLRVLGPAPCFYEKVAGKYSWQIIVISSSRPALAEITTDLPKDFYFDLDPISFL
jgi:primosomal protein N' (replication factor Y) (superfamily II helicase)